MFDLKKELRVGTIIEVSGSSIRIELDGRITELTRTFGGRVYPVGQYGSIVKIHFGRRVLFAFVRLLRMRSEIELEENSKVSSATEDSRIIEADMFGEALWNEKDQTLDFHRGLQHYPLPGQFAHLTTQEELNEIYRGATVTSDSSISPLVPIGTYSGTDGTICYANADKMFGHHCAILGSTGSGKSASVSAIIHSILSIKREEIKCRPKIVIIDPHGEYLKAFGDRAKVFRAYNTTTDEKDSSIEQLKLPYWTLSAEEFRELVISKTQFEATSENNIVYKALSHSRMVQRGWIKKADTWIGKKATECPDPAAPRAVNDKFETEIAQYNRDTPDEFSLEEFESHIRDEQGIVPKSDIWAKMSTSDFKSHASVLDKLSVLRNDARLAFLMTEYEKGQPDLAQIIQQFVGELENERDIRIIDISGLPNEIAGPLTAAIGRILFQYKLWETREERERDPVLLVCEEAHRYVPDQGKAEYESAQTSIRRIAKEGRKYGLALMLVSQRPSDVERTVLSQCNTWLILRLTNGADQEHVSRFLPDSIQGLVKILPSLSRREAIFIGEAAAVPARILLKKLEPHQLPQSQDIPFVNSWFIKPTSLKEIGSVISRWRKE